MKLSEILQSEMVNDNTIICIDKPIGDTGMNLFRKGCWYMDDIVDFADYEITKLSYIGKDNKIYVEVQG